MGPHVEGGLEWCYHGFTRIPNLGPKPGGHRIYVYFGQSACAVVLHKPQSQDHYLKRCHVYQGVLFRFHRILLKMLLGCIEGALTMAHMSYS